jgi:hypothetical protein
MKKFRVIEKYLINNKLIKYYGTEKYECVKDGGRETVKINACQSK